MNVVDGDKLTKKEIMVRLDKIGVHYDKNTTFKAYYVDLYNKAMTNDENRSKVTSDVSSNPKEKEVPHQTPSFSINTSKSSNIHQHSKECNHPHSHKTQRKNGGISLSVILLALVLAFIVAVIQLQRGSDKSLLQKFLEIHEHIHQINAPVKNKLLPLFNIAIKALKPYAPDKVADFLLKVERRIADDSFLIVIPLALVSFSIFAVFLYLLFKRTERVGLLNNE